MKKKLYMELSQLAKDIYLDSKDDLDTLHEKSRDLYEKITVLRHVEKSLSWESASPAVQAQEEATIDLQPSAPSQSPVAERHVPTKAVPVETKIEPATPIVSEPIAQESSEILQAPQSPAPATADISQATVVEEKKALPNDIFEHTATYDPEKVDEIFSVKTASPNTTIEVPEVTEKVDHQIQTNAPVKQEVEIAVNVPKPEVDLNSENSLNDRFNAEKQSLNNKLNRNLQIGLNDRIAFVKQLFNGSQADFQRVVSQLSTFDNLEESLQFVNNVVGKEYGWENKEEYANRFITIIEARFI